MNLKQLKDAIPEDFIDESKEDINRDFSDRVNGIGLIVEYYIDYVVVIWTDDQDNEFRAVLDNEDGMYYVRDTKFWGDSNPFEDEYIYFRDLQEGISPERFNKMLEVMKVKSKEYEP